MFTSTLQRLRELLREENGPTAVEYAVLLALIIVTCLFGISLVGSNASSSFSSTANAMGTSASGSSGAYTGKMDGNINGKGQL